MTKEKNSLIINKIIDEMILEIENLFSDRENLSINIKMIKELTNVLKELEKLHDDQIDEKSDAEQRNKKAFFDTLAGLSKSEIIEPKKELKNGNKKR